MRVLISLVIQSRPRFMQFSTMSAKKPPISAVKTRPLPTKAVIKSEKTRLIHISTATSNKQEKNTFPVGTSNDCKHDIIEKNKIPDPYLKIGASKGLAKAMTVKTGTSKGLAKAVTVKTGASKGSAKATNEKTSASKGSAKAMTVKNEDNIPVTCVTSMSELSVKTIRDGSEKNHSKPDKSFEMTRSDSIGIETYKTNSNSSERALMSKWKPVHKSITVLPTDLLDKVTMIVRLAYENNEVISFNRYFNGYQDKTDSNSQSSRKSERGKLGEKLDKNKVKPTCTTKATVVSSNLPVPASKSTKRALERKQFSNETADQGSPLRTKFTEASQKSRNGVVNKTRELLMNDSKKNNKCQKSQTSKNGRNSPTKINSTTNTNSKMAGKTRGLQRNVNERKPVKQLSKLELSARKDTNLHQDFLSLITPDVLNESDHPDKDFFYLEELFNGTLDKKYERRRKRDIKSRRRDKNDEKREARKRPNYFVAIQITNPEIIRGVGKVQTMMCEANNDLKSAMISLPKLHLTVRVACLENEEHIARMVRALNQCTEVFNNENKDLVVLDVKDVDNFRNNVVFASVTKDENLSRINKLSEFLQECCQKNHVPPSDGKGFTPHITIAKLSKVSFQIKKKVKQIEPVTYAAYKEHHFGKQLVTGLQLCSMFEPKDKAGYYQVRHVSPLTGSRNFSTLPECRYTIADVAHILVSSIMSDVLVSLRKIVVKYPEI